LAKPISLRNRDNGRGDCSSGNETSHADRHGDGCPSTPAMQHSGGADLAAAVHRQPRTPEQQAQEQQPRRPSLAAGSGVRWPSGG
jgi:hypothetical protein